MNSFIHRRIFVGTLMHGSFVVMIAQAYCSNTQDTTWACMPACLHSVLTCVPYDMQSIVYFSQFLQHNDSVVI